MAGSPAAMAEQPHQEPTHESASESHESSDWATKIADQCATDIRAAKNAEDAQDIVLRARQEMVGEFYFPGGDPTAALKAPPILRTSAEAAQLKTAIDKLTAIMMQVDAKYALHTADDSKEQLDDMRLKADRSADASYRRTVEALEHR